MKNFYNRGNKQTWFVCLALMLFMLVFGFIAISNRHQINGDEPHYLVMTNSLLIDHDFNLRNDYEQMKYLDYYHMPLEPHVSSGKQPKTYPYWYSIHGAGLPLLLALPTKLLGIKGAILTMDVLAVLLIALTGLWAKRVSNRNSVAVVSMAALFTSMFFMGLIDFIFPDIPIAILLIGGLLLAESTKLKNYKLFILGLLLGIAAWVHFKTLLTFTPLGLYVLWRIWRQANPIKQRFKQSAYLMMPWAGLVIYMLFKFHEWFNIWIPSQVFPPSSQLAAVSPFVALPAIAFDSAKGLFVYNPGLLLLFAGLPLWYKLSSRTFGYATLATLPTILTLATFSDWTGGFAPMGRYIIEFLPVLVPTIGILYAYSTRVVKGLVIIALTINGALGLILTTLHSPTFINSQPNPVATKFAQLTGVNISKFAPEFSLDALIRQQLFLIPWLALVLLTTGFGLYLAKNQKTT